LNDKRLNDQGGADIGAEHDGKRRHQTDQALGGEGTRDEARGGAALEQSGQPEAGGKRGEAIVQPLCQQKPQVRAEGAQDAAVDHMQAPQQQRDAAHQIEKDQTSHGFPLPDLNRTFRLSPNDRGSIPLLNDGFVLGAAAPAPLAPN